MAKLQPGDIVEVRSREEVSATLDKTGSLKGLLFAPEMYQFCGNRFRVLKRLSTVMIEGVGIREISDAVVLEGARCDGRYHAGCAMTCSLLWKEQWLKRVDTKLSNPSLSTQQSPESNRSIPDNNAFSCQSTSLMKATTAPIKLPIRRYLLEISSGSLRPVDIIRRMPRSMKIAAQQFLHGKRTSPAGKTIRTPTVSMNLQKGELMEVKSIEEILRTLDHEGKNRGLAFTKEMTKYCGKRFAVLKRIDKMINEATGKMRQIANTVLLDGAMCDGEAHGGCARSCYCLWREIWLKRVDDIQSMQVKQTKPTR